MEDGTIKILEKTGERWKDNTNYIHALINAYKNVGINIGKFKNETGAEKYAVIALYSLYIALYSTVIPIYPIMGTIDEAKKLKEDIIVEKVFSVEELEEFLEPIDHAIQPPLEFMMIKARDQEAKEMRRTIKLLSAPPKEDI